jgi:hypothetical protein
MSKGGSIDLDKHFQQKGNLQSSETNVENNWLTRWLLVVSYQLLAFKNQLFVLTPSN